MKLTRKLSWCMSCVSLDAGPTLSPTVVRISVSVSWILWQTHDGKVWSWMPTCLSSTCNYIPILPYSVMSGCSCKHINCCQQRQRTLKSLFPPQCDVRDTFLSPNVPSPIRHTETLATIRWLCLYQVHQWEFYFRGLEKKSTIKGCKGTQHPSLMASHVVFKGGESRQQATG